MSKLIRKNFVISPVQEERLLKYCEELGMSQSQVINHALKKFLDEEDAKQILTIAKDQDKLAQTFLDSLEKLGFDVSKMRVTDEEKSS